MGAAKCLLCRGTGTATGISQPERCRALINPWGNPASGNRGGIVLYWGNGGEEIRVPGGAAAQGGTAAVGDVWKQSSGTSWVINPAEAATTAYSPALG